MPPTIDEVFGQALQLPDQAKESLAERLVAHLAARMDPAVERAHLEAAKLRRDEARSGGVSLIYGDAILNKALRAIYG